MHLVKIFKVMGCLESGRVGLVFLDTLMSREVCELAMWVEGEPYIEVCENL